MTRTARVHPVPDSLATLVGTVIPLSVSSTAALGVAVASTLSGRGLGLPWRITLAISIPLLTLGGSAADTQATAVALRVSVPVVRKLLVLRSRIAPGVDDGHTRAAVLAWLRCQRRTGRSRFCPRLNQRHRDHCQRDQLASAPKPVARWACGLRLRSPAGRLPGRQRGMRVSPRAGAGHD